VRPRLTDRQLDCVVLAAQGKSDGVIAQLLGISGETVHQHIETAKRRYGVASRMQLVVRALYDNLITFADTLR
jgi:LuxR family quorum-sensing system transcriptional regulator CciR